MSKARFTSLDVRCAVAAVRRKALGMRVANVYDLSTKTYLFKLAKPDAKAFLLLESGLRFHCTQYSRDKRDVPSIFAMKLRKHIRTKRIEAVEQYGMDRVVDFTFGSGDATYHLLLELYAAGNLVLTDKDYRIITLLRSYTLDDGTSVAVGGRYPTTVKQPLRNVSEDDLRAMLDVGDPKKAIKNVLSASIPFGNELIEHCLLEAHIDPRTKLAVYDRTSLAALVEQLDKAVTFINLTEQGPGYIISEPAETTTAAAESMAAVSPSIAIGADQTRYTDFLPMLFRQFASHPHIKAFEDFDVAVDEYYSKMYAQRVANEQEAHEATVDKRLDKVRVDQDKRIAALEANEQRLQHCAELIEQNIELVDRVIDTLNASLAQQVDWDALTRSVKEAQRAGDATAAVIHRLKLDENKVALLLYDVLLADEDVTMPSDVVDVSLALTAHANATQYYAEKKKAAEKREKTKAQMAKALESAEKKAELKMKETKVKQTVKQLRKPYWFEKFFFFITTDNYIVVAGRDAQQNELLYRRYLQPSDIYFHADLHGAASVICKNPTGGPLPPMTLAQAGTFALCHSGAWKSKIVTSAYWVHANQVSKTAPTGEYLVTGGFMIRGRKNMLSPAQLVMGLGLLFRLADESLVNHVDERKPKFAPTEDTPSESTKGKEKGEAQPKVWQPKHRKVDTTASERLSEQDESDEELDEELQASLGGLKLVREEEATNSEPDYPSGATPSTEDQPSDAASKKKKLTAYERRQLKKERESSTPQRAPASSAADDGAEVDASHFSMEEKRQAKGPAPVQPKRGQKAKLKKIKEKYAWQDEEDRRVHMQLLGHRVEEKAEDKREGGESERDTETASEQVAPRVERERESAKVREVRRRQQAEEEEEIRQLLKEERLDVLTDEQRAKMEEMTAQMSGVNLNALTGRPLPHDILLYAVPVCAPYETLKEYKYKVKLVPGADKKGRVAKSILSVFVNHPDASTQERDLIKAMTEPELHQVLISDCKIQMSGVQANRGKGGGKRGRGKKR